ncbi:MAG: SOUL family heme-binding protein [Alphaproteobacteria bacterium]
MKKMFVWLAIGMGVILALWVIIPMTINDVKEPAFKVLSSQKNIQIRQYAPYIVAEVTVNGKRREAANQGFRLIADYIFGGNQSKKNSATSEKIAMTAPVIQAQNTSEKIAMTAPVIQELTSGGQWIVQFIMPAEYTMATLPVPNNSKVRLLSVPAKKWAVIKFSGLWSDRAINQKWAVLQNYIKHNQLDMVGRPRTAFYNAPITLPPFRRNEVMVEIK